VTSIAIGYAEVFTMSIINPEKLPDAIAGEYQSLYKYLRDRYANRVVLTFGEIEDLLGFSLPEHARTQKTWWGDTAQVGRRSTQSDAWTLAGRTATVNLLAQSVVFERDAAVESLPRRR